MLSDVMLRNIILNDIMLTVAMLSVAAPVKERGMPENNLLSSLDYKE